MRKRTLRLGLIAATTAAAAMGPLLAAPKAFADYAPNSGDVVGVGSDTLQNMLDFAADGDNYADPGYNQIGNKNKLANFDATADANVRLAYGVDGGQAAQTTCSPGTGSTAGTGNATTTNTGVPCVLNPTIVLRAGTLAVQRPNGSGAGFKALEQDIVAGNNGGTNEVINYSRASAAQSVGVTLPATSTTPGGYQGIDQLEIATDTLPMLETTSPVSHAVPLSAAQLNLIYAANSGSCLTWNDPRIGGTSPDTIIPIIPQVGSGTRSFFLSQIGLSAPGTCAQVGEENDPTALGDQSSPADAIEPMSAGRLDLYLGENASGSSLGTPYFLDPSCAYLSGASACGTGSVSGGTWQTNSVVPAVKPITGTPGGTTGGALFDVTRPLYLYFRTQDGCASYTATTGTHCYSWSGGPYTEHPFQPGATANWVHALFWANGAATPWILTPGGQTDLADAGVTPLTASQQVCTQISPVTQPCPY